MRRSNYNDLVGAVSFVHRDFFLIRRLLVSNLYRDTISFLISPVEYLKVGPLAHPGIYVETSSNSR